MRSCNQPWRFDKMSVRKLGTLVVYAIRIPFVLLFLALFYLLGKSSLTLIAAHAVPFGFSSAVTTVFSLMAVVFFAGISAFFFLYLFKKPGE